MYFRKPAQLIAISFMSIGFLAPCNGAGLDAVNRNSEEAPTTEQTSCNTINGGKACIIFITNKKSDGTFGKSGGVKAGDDICNNEAKTRFPELVNQGVVFKALLGNNSPAQQGMVYYQADQQTYITKANGSYLPMMLDNPIQDTDTDFWTGIKANGDSGTTDNDTCKTWTQKHYDTGCPMSCKTHQRYTYIGNTSLYARRVDCGDLRPLACVAQ